MRVLGRGKTKKRVWLGYTGGTIGEEEKGNGLLDVREGEARKLKNLVPQLFDIADITDEVVFNIDSSDMIPECWIKLAERIVEVANTGEYAGILFMPSYDGIVITHGTDTMGYTAAALAFMLKNQYLPVVQTGSQYIFGHPNSDAEINLTDAIFTAANGDFAEPLIVFYNRIYKATRTIKEDKWKKDAFRSIDYPFLGEIKSNEIIYTEVPRVKRKKPTKMYADTKLEFKIGLIKCYPGMGPDIIDWYIDKGYKGLVLEAFGGGGLNTIDFPELTERRTSLIPAIERAAEYKIPVVITSQARKGSIKLKKYKIGGKLAKLGCIEVEDMQPEIAWIKLMYVSAHTNNLDQVRELMQTNMVGEITKFY